MLIDEKTVERFRQVYEQTTGKPVTDARARDIAQRLLTLYALLLRRLPKRGSDSTR
jgi:hypothetical protein